MSNINIALVMIEMILAGKHTRNHVDVFSTLMDKFDGDRDRAGAVLRNIENDFDFNLISLLEMGANKV